MGIIKLLFRRSHWTIIVLLCTHIIMLCVVLSPYWPDFNGSTSANIAKTREIHLSVSHDNSILPTEQLGKAPLISDLNSLQLSLNKYFSDLGPPSTKVTISTSVSDIDTTSINTKSITGNSSSSGYILNNPGKCKSSKLVIGVISAPDKSVARSAVRGTWGSVSSRLDVSVVFLLGRTPDAPLMKKIAEENDLYGDIVQDDFLDTYRNLTRKTIALLKWVNSSCSDAEFVLKVDDDNFVDVPNLLHFLANINRTEKVIYGKLWRNVKPSRYKLSKWYVSEEDYSEKQYPDFVAGFAYVISRDAIGNLLEAAATLKHLPLEDVFTTGLCAHHANVSRIHEDRFRLTIALDNPCSYGNLFAVHGVKPSSLFMAWWYSNSKLFDSCEDLYPCIQECKQKLASNHSTVQGGESSSSPYLQTTTKL